jgi:hypothetical protein
VKVWKFWFAFVPALDGFEEAGGTCGEAGPAGGTGGEGGAGGVPAAGGVGAADSAETVTVTVSGRVRLALIVGIQ